MIETLSLRFDNFQLEILDQTCLPHQEKWLTIDSPKQMIEAIQALAVRGAPLIGVAAALCLGQFAKKASSNEIREAGLALRNARPTAVNLMHAIDRLFLALDQNLSLEKEASLIAQEDLERSRKVAARGSFYIDDGDGVITHCNTGGLATLGPGTALGAIRLAHELGKKIHVFVDETRPLLQGARLTTWELKKLGIPYTLICDNMAAPLMAQGKIQKCLVGADRIAVNGDSANKIGTYGLAILCEFHKIPFYVLAPNTTYDPNCPNGAAIPIEERNHLEVLGDKAPLSASAWNPAFDVTPRTLIKKIILDDREF